MRKDISCLVLLMMFFLGTVAYGQDLIVTQKNDSINAKITKEKKDLVYFTFVKNKEVRRTLIAREDIKYLQKEFYKKSEIPKNYKPKSSRDYPRFSIGVQGGFSNRTAKLSRGLDPSVKSHFRALKKGVSFGGDFHYFINDYLGLGIKYNKFFSNNVERDFFVLDDRPNVQEWGIKDNIHIIFVGPSLATRLYFGSKEKSQLLMAMSIGHMSYRDEMQIGNRFINSTGNTLGVNYDIEYAYNIYKKISIGLQLSYVAGALNSLDVEENSISRKVDLKEEKESLSRLNFSLGLRLEID